MNLYNYEANSFEAFIRFYEKEVRLISMGKHSAIRDFTASFRRSLVGHGVVVVGRGRRWILTPGAEATLASISIGEVHL